MSLAKTSPLPLSAVPLVLANLVPLFGVLFLNWQVFDILAVFWLENVAIGLVNLLRMMTVFIGKRDVSAIVAMPFFCVHYGLFTLVHGFFIVSLFGTDAGINAGVGTAPWALLETVMAQRGLLLSATALFFSHLFSFFFHFILGRDYTRTTIKTLMAAPYGRVVVLHLTILAGGGLVMLTGAKLWALVLLVILKTGIDLAAHIREHAVSKTKETVP